MAKCNTEPKMNNSVVNSYNKECIATTTLGEKLV